MGLTFSLCYQKQETGNETRNKNGTRNVVYRFRTHKKQGERKNNNIKVEEELEDFTETLLIALVIKI